MIIILIGFIVLIIGLIISILLSNTIYFIGDDLMDFGIKEMFVGLLIFIIGFLFINPCIEKEEVVKTQNIYALNDNSSVEGQFFLMSGSVDEKYTIRYIINTSKGKQVKEIKGDNIYIKEGDYKPHVEYHNVEFKNKNWYLLFLNLTEQYTVFYVPENSVINDYNIDLQ